MTDPNRDVSADLEARYRSYLDVLNDRRLDDLPRHVHERLTYNERSITGRQYRDMIAADIAAAPDLVYDPQIVVASGDRVACRLVFRCAPRGEFLGFRPTGAEIAFAEHVFYRFHEGRIAAVSSLIDRYSVAEQLRSAP